MSNNVSTAYTGIFLQLDTAKRNDVVNMIEVWIGHDQVSLPSQSL